MLRIFSLVLSTFFLFGQIGVELTLHHCMGETSYALLGIEFHQTCTCDHDINGGMDRCCHSEKVTLKIKTDDPVPVLLSLVSPPLYSLAMILPFNNINEPSIVASRFSIRYPEKSPPGSSRHLFILDRTLLI